MALKNMKGFNEYYIYLTASFTAIGGFLLGYDTGVISGALLSIQRDFALPYFCEEILVSSLLLSAALGALMGGFLADIFGRRRILFILSVIFIIAGIMPIFAYNFSILLAIRIISGYAIGVSSLIVPLLISEIAPPSIRGGCVTLNQLAMALGIFCSYLIDYIFSINYGWRWMLGFTLLPAILFFIATFYIPETPRWLISKNRLEEAKKILQKIRREQDILGEIESIQEGIKEQNKGFSVLFQKGVRKFLFIGLLIAIFQQITGINTTLYYLPTFLEYIGFQRDSSAIFIMMSLGAFLFFMTIITIVMIDRVGRRRLLLLGTGIMAISLILFGIIALLPSWNARYEVFSVVLFFIYIAGFSIGLGPITWLLISEIYPLQIRGKAMSLVISVLWLSSFAISISFLTFIFSLGNAWTFWLYAIASILCIIYIYYFIPETSNMSLEQIEDKYLYNHSDDNINSF